MSPASVVLVHRKFLLLIIISFVVSFESQRRIHASNAESSSQKDYYKFHRVTQLPGQPWSGPGVSQFSGYITVNESHGRSLFYWFFEAQSQPANRPLLLWLNGGPGCSSIGYGAALEMGPLGVFRKGGVPLQFNQQAWNKEANLLFLESPVGVGFSYTNTPDDFNHLNDDFVAEDTYAFLVNWLKVFPQFYGREFYIAGESYAGHYVPQLAKLISDTNTKRRKGYTYINLRGLMVGNPEMDDYYDNKGILEYAWSHSIISDQAYHRVVQTCDFKKSNWSAECMSAMGTLWEQFEAIDRYNIYAPTCLPNNPTSFPVKAQDRVMKRMKLIPGGGGYDPCSSNYVEQYFNRKDVQLAMHVNRGRWGKTVNWQLCNYTIFNTTYDYDVFSVLPIYRQLTKRGLKILMYSGDADARVPFIGTQYIAEALQLPLKTNWTTWFYKHQVAGRVIEYEGLTFVTVRGAGHDVPTDKPEEASLLLHSYLSGQSLPTQRW